MVKQGKKPLSSKPSQAPINQDEIFGNTLSVPPDVKEELIAAGKEWRWVDAKQLAANGGYHAKGWTPYIRKTSAIVGSEEFKFGSDPTGILRRGTVILATRPKEICEKHRLYLKQRADIQAGFNRKQAEELQELAKSHGVSARVLEGYDDEDLE